MFRCWKNGKPYEEQAYMAALQKRDSPVAALFRAPDRVGIDCWLSKIICESLLTDSLRCLHDP